VLRSRRLVPDTVLSPSIPIADKDDQIITRALFGMLVERRLLRP
jgi:hypothetical protein